MSTKYEPMMTEERVRSDLATMGEFQKGGYPGISDYGLIGLCCGRDITWREFDPKYLTCLFKKAHAYEADEQSVESALEGLACLYRAAKAEYVNADVLLRYAKVYHKAAELFNITPIKDVPSPFSDLPYEELFATKPKHVDLPQTRQRSNTYDASYTNSQSLFVFNTDLIDRMKAIESAMNRMVKDSANPIEVGDDLDGDWNEVVDNSSSPLSKEKMQTSITSLTPGQAIVKERTLADKPLAGIYIEQREENSPVSPEPPELMYHSEPAEENSVPLPKSGGAQPVSPRRQGRLKQGLEKMTEKVNRTVNTAVEGFRRKKFLSKLSGLISSKNPKTDSPSYQEFDPRKHTLKREPLSRHYSFSGAIAGEPRNSLDARRERVAYIEPEEEETSPS